MLCPKCKKEIVLVGDRYVCTECGIEVPEDQVFAGSNQPDSMKNENAYDASISNISKAYSKDTVVSISSPIGPNISNSRSNTSRSMDGISKNKIFDQKTQNIQSGTSEKSYNSDQNYTYLNKESTQQFEEEKNNNFVTQNSKAFFSNSSYDSPREENNNSSEVYRNPIFDEKLPEQEEQKKINSKEGKAIKEYFAIVTLGIILVLCFLFAGGYFYYKLSNEQVLSKELTTTTTLQDWRDYKDPSDKFSISLPGEAKITQSDISLSGSTISATYVSAATSNLHCILQYSTLPDSFVVSNMKEFYEGILLGMLGDSKGEIISNNEVDFLGSKGSEYLLKIDQNYSRGKMVLLNKDLYVLVVNSTSDNPDDYNKFINSFQLKS